jgi:hypothetical protein
MNWTKEEKDAAETAIFRELRKWDQVSTPSAMSPALRRAVLRAIGPFMRERLYDGRR